MMKKYINLVLFSGMVLACGCSLEVKKAHAPTDPPKIDNVKFNTKDIQGTYAHFNLDAGKFREGVAPKVFLWPTQRFDEKTKKNITLSFAEQVLARQKITAAADELAEFEKDLDDFDTELHNKYEVLKSSALSSWKANQCYSMCSEDAFFCLPSDVNNIQIDEDDWKEVDCAPAEEQLQLCLNPEEEEEEESPSKDPDCTKEEAEVKLCKEEEKLLLLCQENQENRNNFDGEKELEKGKLRPPILEKTDTAGRLLTQAIGDENFIDIGQFKFYFGAFDCAINEKGNGKCQKLEKGAELFIGIDYGENFVSNYKNNSLPFKVSDINLDQVDGYLSFRIPAIDVDNENKVFGEIFFDLEFVKDGNRMKIDGDIRLTNFNTKEEKIGRFASSGFIKPEL